MKSNIKIIVLEQKCGKFCSEVRNEYGMRYIHLYLKKIFRFSISYNYGIWYVVIYESHVKIGPGDILCRELEKRVSRLPEHHAQIFGFSYEFDPYKNDPLKIVLRKKRVLSLR